MKFIDSLRKFVELYQNTTNNSVGRYGIQPAVPNNPVNHAQKEEK